MNPFTPIIDQLQKQAAMRFLPEDVARVMRVCMTVTRGQRIDIDCPLPSWDSTAMGVAFRRVDRDKASKRKYKRTASFVLNGDELANETLISRKASVAVEAINLTVLCGIREVKKVAEVKPAEAVHAP